MTRTTMHPSKALAFGFVAFLAISMAPVRADQTVFHEDFELGWRNWTTTNGVWDIGTPTSGPGGPQEGVFCAGTVLSGHYPNSKTSTLVSPTIDLPTLSNGERITLRMWHWFRLVRNSYGNDLASVWVYKVSDASWTQISWDLGIYNPKWNQGTWDLTDFAGEQIQLGFYITTNYRDTEEGWFIDDIRITCGVPVFNNPETFRHGIGDWSWENGIWEIGEPTAGPVETPSDRSCAGTRLDGAFWNSGWSRLVSPPVTLTPKPGESPKLRLEHWYQLPNNSYGADQAHIQISTDNGANWDTLRTVTGYSTGWEPVTIPLGDYVDQTVRLGFYFTSNYRDTDDGYFVDNVQIEGIVGHWMARLTAFGQGHAGSGGHVPELEGVDGPSTGEFAIRFSNGAGGAIGLVWVGFVEGLNGDFFGGEFYIDFVPGTWAVFPIQLAGSGPGGGTASLFGADVTIIPDQTLIIQGSFADPGASEGVSLSNGMRLLVTQD